MKNLRRPLLRRAIKLKVCSYPRKVATHGRETFQSQVIKNFKHIKLQFFKNILDILFMLHK